LSSSELTKLKIPAYSISSDAAANGFLAINFTFSSILSIGLRTKTLASFENYMEAIVKTIQIKIVLPILNKAVTLFPSLT
jgi:hypothetical protein